VIVIQSGSMDVVNEATVERSSSTTRTCKRNCHVCNWNKCFTVQNNMNPRFQVWSHWKCSPSSCMFFYNPWETQREIDILWWKKTGSDICVLKQKITLKKMEN